MKNGRLVISLATRGRPQQVVSTIMQSTSNLALSNTLFMVQVDQDDKPTIDALMRAPLPKCVEVNIRPREDTIAAKWNRAMSEPADVYLVVGDDDPYITPGYDAKILEAGKRFPDGIAMVYGHMANASFSGSVAPTAKLVEMMGYIQPEYFPYWFCDHWTDDVARIIGRISFADIRTDQSRAGKTQEMREPAWWATWFDAAHLMRRKIAHNIINSAEFDVPEWQKDVLRTHHPLIEYRSRWINDNVRAMAKQYESWNTQNGLHEARYQRVRQCASAMVPHLLDDYGMDTQEAAKFREILVPPINVINLPRAYA